MNCVIYCRVGRKEQITDVDSNLKILSNINILDRINKKKQDIKLQEILLNKN